MDVHAFTAFYQQYYSLALTVAQQRLGGLSDAEGITAEAFRIAWAHHQEGQALSLPWLYGVVRNLIGNEYRRLDRADDFARAVAPLIEEQAAGLVDDDAREIRRCLAQLPEDDRDLLYMAYWEGLSRGEIATILGCPAPLVRGRLMRARQRLRTVLTDDVSDTTREVNTRDGRV